MPPTRKTKTKLSRKELQQLKEYGELDPLSSITEEKGLDDVISKALGRSGYGRFTGKLGKPKGTKTDRKVPKRSTRPDAYSRLLSSLSATGSLPVGQGPVVSDDEDMEDMEDMEDVDDVEDTEEIENGSEAADDEEQAQSAAGSDREYNVDEVDSDELDSEAEQEGSSDSEEGPKEMYEAFDYMEKHYADDDSEGMHKKLAAATNKEYEQSVTDDSTLGPIAAYDLAGETARPANPRPLKQRLVKPAHKLNKSSEFSAFQHRLFSWLDQYRDVVYAGRSHANEDELTTAYAIHAMNHVMKAKDLERKNNTRLAKAHASGTDVGELRDRGFTRPRVLIVVPFRNSAFRLIEKLLTLASATKEKSFARFAKEYGPDEDEERRHSANKRKPEDFTRTFSGNIDDAFRIGLQLHYNKSVKLYADFYRADIIVASPIGLRMTTGAQSGDRKDFDFLSSIEMVVVDQCDVLLMQNWDHVVHLFEHMNLMPKKDHGCDFSRIRLWQLDGMAKYRRQTVLLSQYMTPEMQALFNHFCSSIEGKVRIKPAYAGAVNDVVAKVSQVFRRVAVKRLASANDDRFGHFVDQVLSDIDKSQKHMLIFVSSYFDFVRVRNTCKERGYVFAAISEYSTKSEAMRARIKLYEGEMQFILYSERAHFYHRYPIKGIHHLVFYSLPDHPHFYSELVNLMLTHNDEVSADQLSCTAFYTKFDQLKLERIVGSKLVTRLVSSERSQFTFA